MVNPDMFTCDEKEKMWRAEPVEAGRKRYALCTGCLRAIRVDRAFLGSLHICAEPEDRGRNRARARHARRMMNLDSIKGKKFPDVMGGS